uniref:Uncharacterized protein n=1 Tax=Anopheles melas TaxID=34690 RepID=A0A182U0U6_9DIPT
MASDSVPVPAREPSPEVEEHFVPRSVAVLFVSQRGLQLRKFHSLLPSGGGATYTIQFCDLERWSPHLKLASVGLTPDCCSSMDTTDSSRSNLQDQHANVVRFVDSSPSANGDKRDTNQQG